MKEFEAASGITIDRWSYAKKLGEAVKAVMQYDNTVTSAHGVVKRTLGELEHHVIPALKRFEEELNNVNPH